MERSTHEDVVSPDVDVGVGSGFAGRAVRRISWGAVFAGAVVAIMALVMLGLLGVAFGAGTIGSEGRSAARELGVGAGIWWLVTGIIAVFLGGLVAGRLASPERRHDGALHGVVVWAVTSLVLLFSLASALGEMAGGSLSLMQGAQMSAQASPSAVREAASAVSHGALWAFVFFSATSIAGAIGGAIASPLRRKHTIPRAAVRRSPGERRPPDER